MNITVLLGILLVTVLAVIAIVVALYVLNTNATDAEAKVAQARQKLKALSNSLDGDINESCGLWSSCLEPIRENTEMMAQTAARNASMASILKRENDRFKADIEKIIADLQMPLVTLTSSLPSNLDVDPSRLNDRAIATAGRVSNSASTWSTDMADYQDFVSSAKTKLSTMRNDISRVKTQLGLMTDGAINTELAKQLVDWQGKTTTVLLQLIEALPSFVRNLEADLLVHRAVSIIQNDGFDNQILRAAGVRQLQADLDEPLQSVQLAKSMSERLTAMKTELVAKYDAMDAQLTGIMESATNSFSEANGLATQVQNLISQVDANRHSWTQSTVSVAKSASDLYAQAATDFIDKRYNDRVTTDAVSRLTRASGDISATQAAVAALGTSNTATQSSITAKQQAQNRFVQNGNTVSITGGSSSFCLGGTCFNKTGLQNLLPKPLRFWPENNYIPYDEKVTTEVNDGVEYKYYYYWRWAYNQVLGGSLSEGGVTSTNAGPFNDGVYFDGAAVGGADMTGGTQNTIYDYRGAAWQISTGYANKVDHAIFCNNNMNLSETWVWMSNNKGTAEETITVTIKTETTTASQAFNVGPTWKLCIVKYAPTKTKNVATNIRGPATIFEIRHRG